MLKMSKSQLKAKMLEVFRTIEETGEELIVTSHGTPVLKISPLKKERSVEEVFGVSEYKPIYAGDILENTADEWTEI